MAAGVACRRVQLFYDVLSPYSWVGFEILCRYRQKWSMKLEFCPFFLSGIMVGSSNRPPGMVAAKGKYMGKDIKRLSEFYQIPLKSPKNPAEVLFEKGSLKAQRFLMAAESECPGKVEELSRQLWMRVWSRDEDITEVASLREAGVKAAIDASMLDKLESLIKTDVVKEKLKQRTQEALDQGCFGAPFIVVHLEDEKKERFFGSDRMELIAHVMGEKWEGPLNDLRARL